MSQFHTFDHDQQVASLKRLALTALGQWDGDFVRLDLIKYRENAVFCATRSDGQRSALRVHRDGYHSEEALRSELQWMEALAADGIHVPQIIRTREGEHLARVHSDELGESRYIDMLGWLDGTSIGSAEHGLAVQSNVAGLFFDAGAVAARIHQSSARWVQPNAFSRHAWDEEGLIGQRPFWGPYWELDLLEPAQRELLQATRQAARADLRRYGRNLDNFGMIHADLVPENLLLDQARLHLIDFDDAGFGWHMFELATALYFCLDDPRYTEIEAALLGGYHSVKPLTEADRATLPLFLALRGVTYLGWIHTRRESRTAEELAPMLIERACHLARTYLDQR
ncbi:aminoglycoside phosphotransferase [Metapseudomonas resinovorans]|uniref:phosphotransferase enzyme family protein n=1 Tax=Metapseudomonas resinovorans TaxID=53412 RepID=UPI0009861822|nr:phosphotransferase [Pseudomonas resinovorans]GLZ89238.1 aminoglycoside phosphotransferase [Pseudomonas resinovorans]